MVGAYENFGIEPVSALLRDFFYMPRMTYQSVTALPQGARGKQHARRDVKTFLRSMFLIV